MFPEISRKSSTPHPWHTQRLQLQLPIYDALRMISSVENSQSADGNKASNNNASMGDAPGGNVYCFGKGEHGRLGCPTT